jgi:hypothetical protein
MQLPSVQPSVWFGTFGFLLALLTLPWFRAEFIPSGETPAERFGTFYMYGMVFGQEWVPLADTWMYAAEQVCLDVGVFFAVFLVHAIPSELLVCSHVKLTLPGDPLLRRSVVQSPWFRGVEIVYWLWRISELMALASFYGGIWPALVQNILVLWLLFVGMTLGTSLCTVGNSLNELYWMTNGLDGCEGCAKGPLKATMVMTDQQQQEADDCHVVELDCRLSASCSSGTSASSTPFNRSPRAKNRKRSRG